MASNHDSPTVKDAAEPSDELISRTVDTPDTPSAWQDLEAKVPTLRSRAEVASFTECVLVELRHEPVAARFRSELHYTMEWVLCRAEHLTVETTKPFVRVCIDERLGVSIEPCSRATAREYLCRTLLQDELGVVDVQPLAVLSLDKL